MSNEENKVTEEELDQIIAEAEKVEEAELNEGAVDEQESHLSHVNLAAGALVQWMDSRLSTVFLIWC